MSIGAIADECFVLWHHQQAQPAVECLHHLMDLTTSLKAWFYRREQTEALLEQVSDLGDFFAAIEPFSQEVSLKPIDDLTMRLARKLDVLSPV